MANAINWFEIPAQNIERAAKFYGEVFENEIQIQDMGHSQMAFLHFEQGEVGGAVVKGEGYKPSSEGSLIYLNGGNDLSTPLQKVQKAGGTVVLPKTKISDEIGYMAIFMDCEGNKMAFHSPN